MKRYLLAVGFCGALAATAAVAQGRGSWGGPDGSAGRRDGRFGLAPADREAYLDARIAGLRAGLKLNADQEKMWPPVEEAMRNIARQRAEARRTRRERWASTSGGGEVNIPDQLKFMADRQAASSEALRKLADASAPLYATLDPAQKRRLSFLTRGFGGERGMRHGHGMRRGAAEDGSRDFADRERRFGDPAAR